VGGSGLVVEKRGEKLLARVYPVSSQARSIFRYPDGISESEIRLQVNDWRHLSVKTQKGVAVRSEMSGGVFEFTISPGENYEIH
jgi:hypothetical protein